MVRRLACERLEPRLVLDVGPLLISEFVALNKGGLADADGDCSDWIEIHNPAPSTVSLEGWSLTDDPADLQKWQFPDVPLAAGDRLVVFASEKDRRDPLGELHTNFKLDGNGEYLALVQPDGSTIASAYDPQFPPQVEDVSYGLGLVGDRFQDVLVPEFAPAKAFVPADDSLGLTWTQVAFNPAGWLSGTTGVGYDRNTSGVDYNPLIGINVENLLYNKRPGAYMRVEFDVADPSAYNSMLLRMKYDDGFVAYLNGRPIADDNAPDPATANDGATALHDDNAAVVFVDFDVTTYLDLLQVGKNVLAVHGMNRGNGSSDLLIHPRLEASGIQGDGTWTQGYFTVPTPGGPNGTGIARLGPLIREVTSNPPQPTDSQDLPVTAKVMPAFNPIDQVTLHYRVDFGNETALPMRDDGSGGDATAGDNIFTAVIPAGASYPSDMVRWYVTATDTAAQDSRQPLFLFPTNSPEYFGTVVADPSIATPLPVFQYFVQNTSAEGTRTGTRASVYYLGEFYDNVFIRLRGMNYTHGRKIEFNDGHHFRFDADLPRVDEINLNPKGADPVYIRAPLSWETYADAGVPGSLSFIMHTRRNGTYVDFPVFVEQPDPDLLRRNGLDPDGALYKMYNQMRPGQSAYSGVEKKTRKDEDNSDLQRLIDAVNPNNANRARDLFDLVDIPAVINYIAATTIIHDNDHVAKNYYVYRDTERTGEWMFLPWDKDLTFGVNWGVNGIVGNQDPYSHPLFGDSDHQKVDNLWNGLIDAIHDTPATRQMYVRRLRTLMDELLQPATTPYAQRRLEGRVDELKAALDADPSLRSLYSQAGVTSLKNEYLVERRQHLFDTHGPSGDGLIPTSHPASFAVNFGVIDFSPLSGNQDEEYIQLVNPNSFAVDISGWRLGEAVEHTFKPGTVITAGGSLYVTPNALAFRARTTGPRGGQGLLVQGNYEGHLSSFGETIRLFDAASAEVDSLAYQGNPSPAQQFLRIAEVMYHPAEPTPAETAAGFVDKNAFEFIELVNTGPTVLAPADMANVRLTQGVRFTFGGVALPPGQRIVVVANRPAFEFRYGAGVSIAGQFTGSLDNSGERIKLEDPLNGTIQEFRYDDSGDWPGRADGKGSSLEVVDTGGDYDSPLNWRASVAYGGTPGGAAVAELGVVVNEVLSHTDTPLLDAIELYNATAQVIDVGGWYLSDSWGWGIDPEGGDYQKFRIPAGTTIAAGGYLVFDERDFNPNGLWNPDRGAPGPNEFSLNGAHGDDVWLLKADAAGNLTHFADHVDFGAARSNESFGRWPNGTGGLYPMLTPTLDRAHPAKGLNSGPRIGPLIISEVHYQPGSADPDALEFIEVYNPTAAAVDLTNWRLAGGVSYDFPAGTMLASHAALVVVSFPLSDAARLAAFRSYYGVGVGVPIAGGYEGPLADGGAKVQLQRPDASPPDEPGFIPRLLEDEVEYAATWYPDANGGGDSLNRLGSRRWGDAPTSWTAAAPSPGSVNLVAEVAGRHVFYNNSAFDGNTAAANAKDDDAIAPDKAALLPGQAAAFANYTSYSRGINGIMVDIADLPGNPTAADFVLKVGNDFNPAAWAAVPAPAAITLRREQGAAGTDRVTLVWPDGAIRNQWLQVTVLANANTGLAQNDVFYFGNAIGEAGNSPTDARVDAVDMLLARNNPRTFRDAAPLDFAYDFNRDGRVNATDVLLARNNQTNLAMALTLITAPGSKSAGERSSQPKALSPKLDWLAELDPTPPTRCRVGRSAAESHQDARQIPAPLQFGREPQAGAPPCASGGVLFVSTASPLEARVPSKSSRSPSADGPAA